MLHKLGIMHPPNWIGRKHKEETKRKIGLANSVYQQGKGNNMHGRIWIYNLEAQLSMPIKPDRLDQYLQNGWNIGRKLKF
jgi:hypothetical protein